MTDTRAKRLRMFAGPNGSGKSSIIRSLAREWSPATGLFRLNHYLNADEVERALVSAGLDLARFDVAVPFERLCDSLRAGGRLAADHPFFCEAVVDGSVVWAPRADGYLAAAVVDFLREELMRRGDSFSFETVMSHPSKVEFFGRARAEGYKTYLYFVCTSTAELNVARVRTRVQIGGHAVPEDKIRERYARCLDLASVARAQAYRAYFFDNSGSVPVWLAEFDPEGTCQLRVSQDRLPRWFQNCLDNHPPRLIHPRRG
ncbi:hypothetical protein [Fimbriiglobus ruber]|uniref:UDP-N-acetylglucosamine kinase n=1 Tax=Fimbriiglobus ruber TaxID=1908690 RepID=A0A225D078_9BACT|nr:hypothetical protein [Fimbriiglobus ruber]OWK35020.1 hypothetical protein FRUB_09862 [Fimbriiglobus ruber]